MRMVLTGHQLCRTFTDSLRDPAAQKTAVVQEELQQFQVRAAELAPQREVVAQSRVQVLDQGAATGRLCHGQRHGVEDGVELAAHPGAQAIPALPVQGGCPRLAVQHACRAHDVFR